MAVTEIENDMVADQIGLESNERTPPERRQLSGPEPDKKPLVGHEDLGPARLRPAFGSALPQPRVHQPAEPLPRLKDNPGNHGVQRATGLQGHEFEREVAGVNERRGSIRRELTLNHRLLSHAALLSGIVL
ncbi:MAG: hypothetical protein ACYCV4_09160 [Dermatophilaceae bacterium]